eukprot:365535-Chlamydomonas_euryale.AAC.29
MVLGPQRSRLDVSQAVKDVLRYQLAHKAVAGRPIRMNHVPIEHLPLEFVIKLGLEAAGVVCTCLVNLEALYVVVHQAPRGSLDAHLRCAVVQCKLMEFAFGCRPVQTRGADDTMPYEGVEHNDGRPPAAAAAGHVSTSSECHVSERAAGHSGAALAGLAGASTSTRANARPAMSGETLAGTLGKGTSMRADAWTAVWAQTWQAQRVKARACERTHGRASSLTLACLAGASTTTVVTCMQHCDLSSVVTCAGLDALQRALRRLTLGSQPRKGQAEHGIAHLFTYRVTDKTRGCIDPMQPADHSPSLQTADMHTGRRRWSPRAWGAVHWQGAWYCAVVDANPVGPHRGLDDLLSPVRECLGVHSPLSGGDAPAHEDEVELLALNVPVQGGPQTCAVAWIYLRHAARLPFGRPLVRAGVGVRLVPGAAGLHVGPRQVARRAAGAAVGALNEAGSSMRNAPHQDERGKPQSHPSAGPPTRAHDGGLY